MTRPHLKLTLLNIAFIGCLILFPALKTQADPTIEITSPTNGTAYTAGDTIAIHANASNPGGTAIYAVEFYINDVYIGKDITAPYQFDWISVEGTHLLSVREDHGYCYKTPSVPIQIIVKRNAAPSVQLTDPVNGSIHFNPLPVEIAATAIDTDGTVNHVDFFINSIYIGSDHTFPFKINWQSIPGIYTITAKAVDNKHVSTISAPITITVYPAVNSAPTISITSPIDGSIFALGTTVSITAHATDSDGNVSSVEFFANNTSIGTDNTAPYESSWTAIGGLTTIYAKVTDDDCATAFDTLLISIIDPNAPPYIIQNTSGQCSDPSFCLPVKAIVPVTDIIGYDLVLHYDKTKVHPTGNMNISNDLIDRNYVSYIINNIDSLSQINISIFLNSSAPPNTTFHGIGQLFCAEFSKTSGFAPNDTAFFSITDLQESYPNGIHAKQASPGHYINLKNTVYRGALKFWTDESPISYDALAPSHYLVTTIYGTNSSCSNKSALSTHPDVNGKFSHSLINGTSMKLERDILPGTNVQPVINGMDTGLGYAVVLSDPSFVPTIYQIIALDVNLDGVISAGDLSQINQRSIKTILEFKQKWNYNNNGSSNGQLSKDWLFIDSTLLANSAYQLSATYPSDDGVGFSKYKVPVVPFCLPIPSAVCNSCVSYQEGTLKGILIGDVNGNYDAIPADGQLKRIDATKGSIYLDLTKAKNGKNYTDVPVYFTSSEKIVALDFSLQLEETMQYIKILQPAAYLNDALANLDEDHMLRFTSNSIKNYEADKPVAFLRIVNSNGSVTSSDLSELTGYLNGEPVLFEIKGSITTSSSNVIENKDVQIYPNPATEVLNVIATEKSIVQLIDLQGKQVLLEKQALANEKLELHLQNFKSGSYLLKVVNEKFENTQVIVVESGK